MSIQKSDFNNLVKYYISDLPRSIVSWHSAAIPSYSANTWVYENVGYLGLYASPPQSTILAADAYDCILQTAVAHSSIRRVWVGLRTDSGTSASQVAYAYLNANYALDMNYICSVVRNSAGIYSGLTIERQKVVNGLSGFYSNFVNTVNNAGTLDFRVCHSSCHNKCHSSRSRR